LAGPGIEVFRNCAFLQHILIAGCALAAGVVGAVAQEHIGSTALARNDVTRESAGASAPLVTGDSVFRNETVRTGADSNARLVFLDSTNLGVGPTSSVKLDQFVYVGQSNGQKMTVNLAKGVFRFTTGVLDKKAYEITTPTAAIGVRGTVLDIAVQGPDTRVTLVEGQALVCPRRPGVSFAQQERSCARAAGGVAGAHCDCVELKNVGQTAQVKKTGSASLTSNPVNYAFNDGGFASGVLCGR
jgi:hypothetical protein